MSVPEVPGPATGSMPASLARRLPLRRSTADLAPSWPLPAVLLLAGVAVLSFGPSGSLVTQCLVTVLVVTGGGWLWDRFGLRASTVLDADGIHLRDQLGRRTTLAWADVADVRPSRVLGAQALVRAADRRSRLVLWGLTREQARQLADDLEAWPVDQR